MIGFYMKCNFELKWVKYDKVFKNVPSKIFDRQPLKKFK